MRKKLNANNTITTTKFIINLFVIKIIQQKKRNKPKNFTTNNNRK